ncbi:MAG: fumarylacetoacetate hydrolase family protein [Bacteroidales bacterium]|nr:fumarylacetoacetate hydrolase family protein [Bacteroidales bacterium]
MKIVCIGRNYTEHARELNNPVPDEPVVFMKPDSALLLKNKPFFLPDFSREIHHEVEVVVRINRVGKHIQERFAHRYYNEVSLGIDFTARDLQNRCKKEGKPWEIAKGFDGSAVLGEFISLESMNSPKAIPFHLDVNGNTVQRGNTADMLFSIDRIIAYVSRFVTFKIGDLIYTGTPAGVGPVAVNDRLEGYLEDRKMFNFLVK